VDEIPRELLLETHDFAEGRSAGRPLPAARETRDSGGSSAARAAKQIDRRTVRRPRVDRSGPAEVPGDGYAVGSFVLHPRFGGGQILDREGSGKHLKLTIFFADHGPKKILPAYTKLRVQAD
jgi:hypothetical protein